MWDFGFGLPCGYYPWAILPVNKPMNNWENEYNVHFDSEARVSQHHSHAQMHTCATSFLFLDGSTAWSQRLGDYFCGRGKVLQHLGRWLKKNCWGKKRLTTLSVHNVQSRCLSSLQSNQPLEPTRVSLNTHCAVGRSSPINYYESFQFNTKLF